MLEKGVIVAGDFRIDGVLGEGGMGVVYEATQLVFDRTVALKLIATALSEDIAFRERFRREGRLQARLEHPHIIDVYAAGTSDYGLYLAMRLVRGPSLSDLIGTPALTVDRTVRLLSQVASALDAAHEVGLIHRDIKPHNILIDQRRDHSYLADFGVTKARGTPGLTQVGQRVGTLAYMAPEQFRGYESTERSDIYSFGAVLYECFVGTVPYPFPTEASIINAHLSEPIPAVTARRPELPPMLDDIICKAMAKEPEDRYQSGSELMEDVARAVGRTPFELPTVASAPDPAAGPVRSGVPADAGETLRSALDQTKQSTERDPATTPATFLSPEPAPAAAATSVAPVAEPTAPAEEGQPRFHTTELSREPAAAASTKLAEPRQPEEIVARPSSPARKAAAPTDTAKVADGIGGISRPARTRRQRERVEAAPSVPRPAVSLRSATIAASVGVLALGAIGLLVGRSNAPENRRTLTSPTHRQVRSGDITVSSPVAWTKQPSAPMIPGLKLRNAVALAPEADPAAGGFIAGKTARSWPTFLPASFRRVVGERALRRREVVRLGDLSAFRYPRLKVRGFEGVVTIYALPQSGTEVIALCYGSASAPVPASCDSIAASLQLANGQRYPLGLSADYAGALNGALRKLEAARKAGRGKLASATTRSRQAAAAGAVAAAYGRAVRQIRAAVPTEYVRPAHVRIVAVLVALQNSYSRLAQAARSGERARYDAARRLILARETRLRAEVAGLRRLGFRT